MDSVFATAAGIVFSFSLLTLAYTWFGYYGILTLLSGFGRKRSVPTGDDTFTPSVSILVSAYNEEDVIAKRIENLLALDYPADRLEILIGSDGSTDGTVEAARTFEGRGVKVVAFEENRGRADVHNDLVAMAEGEILVFTDADTEFEPEFVKKIVRPFSDPKVGAAVGRLSYRVEGGAIARNEGLYWRYELRLKELENRLGLVNNGTGACMAFRKELFTPLRPVDDIDTASVIDIILEGYKVVYVEDALAYDIPPHSARSEYKARVRGTSKTVASVFGRVGMLEWFKHPVVTWSLFSHRFLRYMTPYFMVIAFLSNASLLGEGLLYKSLFMLQAAFYLFVLVGWVADRAHRYVPLASSLYSFCVAMSGMMVGVAKAVAGRVTVTYKTEDGMP
ncbi:MAG TPA: glycosyltransferase family 2 protein [Deltaproteobacteria bacterium]|nr:glycosyltransferase family 2 protein [Deltaproteobacteria bacterium]